MVKCDGRAFVAAGAVPFPSHFRFSFVCIFAKYSLLINTEAIVTTVVRLWMIRRQWDRPRRPFNDNNGAIISKASEKPVQAKDLIIRTRNSRVVY